MSLVGNMEDLGLGEILQIVSLSRKSGVLTLQSGMREARVIFRNGQVIRATSTTFQQNMGEVLIQQGVIDPGVLKRALGIQADEGYTELLGVIMVERFGVSADAIEAVVREQIENVVYSLFAWTKGTFKFEMQEVAKRDDIKVNPVQFMLSQGLNPQFLAMEGSRIIDEKRHRGELDEEPEAAVAPEPAPYYDYDLAPSKASARPEPAAPLLWQELAEPFSVFESGPPQSIEVTARLAMAGGVAALAYGMIGLLNYYSRDWQAVLSEPDLVTVSKLSVFFRFGFIPWTVTLSSLYLVWAAHQFLQIRKDSLKRLTEGCWCGVAVSVIYEAVEFVNWARLASSTPSFSFYVVGAVGSLLGAVLLSAPFAGLLFYLKSDGISREFRKASQLQSRTAVPR